MLKIMKGRLLYVACKVAWPDTVAALLDAHADPLIPTNDGARPLNPSDSSAVDDEYQEVYDLVEVSNGSRGKEKTKEGNIAIAYSLSL